MTEGINIFWYVLVSITLLITLSIIIIVNINSAAGKLFDSIKQNNAITNILNAAKPIFIFFNKFSFDDPVNYTILLIRKPYNDDMRSWIVYTIFTIVAFYFILTIF